jgi:hypothetical protein
MCAKRKSKVVVVQSLDTLRAEAVRLYHEIQQQEDAAAPLYWDLGEKLRKIAKDLKIGTNDLVAYACADLDIAGSYAWRAIRTYDRHKDDRSEVNGLTVYQALGHERKDKQPVTPLPKDAELSPRECRIALWFEARIGGKERAEEVAKRIFVDHEELPVKAKKSRKADPKLKPIVRKFRMKHWEEVQANPRGFVDGAVERVRKIEAEYRRKIAEATTAATTVEAQLKLEKDLTDLRRHRDWAMAKEREAYKVKDKGNFAGNELAFVLDVQQQLYAALDIPAEPTPGDEE